LALKLSKKLVDTFPENTTYLDTHAWVLYNLKDYTNAKKFLEKAIGLGKDVSSTIVEHYGDVLFKLGQQDNALAQWKRARELGEKTDLLDKKITTGSLHE
jgi:tetratricopeptide (TPR) repeat protein